MLGLNDKKVYDICYQLNVTRGVKLADVTNVMVADAFQKMIGRPID